MKNLFNLILVIIAAMIIGALASCEKEEVNPIDPDPDPDTVVVKYSDFANIDEMLRNSYISAAVEANSLEIHYGSDPINLVGTYEVLTKQNHYVQINGVQEEYQEAEFGQAGFVENWKPFLCNVSSEMIQSHYSFGTEDRSVSYEIQGNGNSFTMFFQDEENPWYTRLRGLYDDMIEINEGVHIVSGEVNEDNSITLKCLWIRVWQNESTEGTGNWSYSEFTIEKVPEFGAYTDSRDGKVYRTITIGNQTWFLDPLIYEPKEEDGYSGYSYWNLGMENDGDDKLYGTIGESELSPNYTGYAYTWAAATNGETGTQIRGVCPEGWHIPTAQEWSDLVNYLGGKSVAGEKLKSRIWWHAPFVGTNESGFNFGGYAYIRGTTVAGEWTAGEGNPINMILTVSDSGEMNYAGVGIIGDDAYLSEPLPGGSNYNAANSGFAIRCIKDND